MAAVQCDAIRFNQLRAVLFDKDGTLADVRSFLRELGDRRAKAVDHHVPGTGEFLRRALGISPSNVDMQGALAVASRFENEVSAATLIAAQGYGWSDALAIARNAFAEVDDVLDPKAAHTPPFSDVQPCLERLKAAGLKVGIVSADSPKFVTEFVGHYRLQALCPVALGSTPDCLKPDPQLLWKACGRLGVRSEEVIVVGDASSDVLLARQGRCAGVVIVRRDAALQDVDFGADACIDTLDQLVAIAEVNKS
ncbi:MAG: HAD-IA family hydrolase [Cyanobacteria bacterium P01_C01_bin.89]